MCHVLDFTQMDKSRFLSEMSSCRSYGQELRKRQQDGWSNI
uniref:Uncharacterized protein n=1 Tax=Triticum urartu TaxID=4572 RepID=A0A8R7Q8E7_TRIUA